MGRSASPVKASPAKTIVVNGLAVALVFVTAMFVHVRLPFAGPGGMIHMGGLPLFVFALLYGRRTGAIAGAFGLALFDLLTGWAPWAPFSFVIGGAMGWTVGFAAEKKTSGLLMLYVVSILLANVLTIGGYYVAEGLLYGNWLAPVGSIPVNFLQVTLPALLAYPIAARLRKVLGTKL